jgi:peptidoglycan/LPS O-acetylase OafA/YrhL
MREDKIKRTDSAPRIEFLDSVRGLAAMAVLFSHAAGIVCLPSFMSSLLQIPLLYACVDGKAAVVMFFVLSGFVLSRPYLKPVTAAAPPRTVRLPPFYVKRITRIYIPFLVILTLSAVAKLWWFRSYATNPPQGDWFLQFWRQPLTLHSFLRQCLFLVHDNRQQLLIQDWSLGVELKASALLPFLVLIFRRGKWWLLAIAGALLLWDSGQNYISFILGILLAANLEFLVSKIQNRTSKWLLLAAGLFCYQARLFFVFLNASQGHVAEKAIWTIGSIGCVLILLAIFSSQRFQKVMSHGFFVFLGRISYGVYLIQFITLMCVIPWLDTRLNSWGLQSAVIVMPFNVIAATLITAAAATVFYAVVEQPSIQLGHHLASAYNRKFGPKPQPVTLASAAPPDVAAGAR